MAGSRRARGPELGAPAAGAERAVIEVDAALAGKRLDQALAAAVPGLSRAAARRIIGMGGVWLGGTRCRIASKAVYVGDVLTATWHPDVSAPALYPLRVVHEDASVVVVDKPAGQLSQGSELGDVGSLIYALGKRYGRDVRLMHRLDKPASGLLVATRTPAASAALTPQFRDHTIRRSYLAVTQGAPASGACEAALVKDGRRVRVATPEDGGRAMSARTDVEVLRAEGPRTLVRATLHTGRTHQIRVHLASLGAPLVGDRMYGGPEAERLCLHAAVLGFEHPGGGRVDLEREPPDDFWLAAGMDRNRPDSPGDGDGSTAP